MVLTRFSSHDAIRCCAVSGGVNERGKWEKGGLDLEVSCLVTKRDEKSKRQHF